MPTFLDNSLAGLRRGYGQLYGQQAARSARPSGQLFNPAPVARNPEVGQPVGNTATQVLPGTVGTNYPTVWTPEQGTAEQIAREEAQQRAYDQQVSDLGNRVYSHGVLGIPDWFARLFGAGQTAYDQYRETQDQSSDVPLNPNYRGSSSGQVYYPPPIPYPAPTPVANNPEQGQTLGADDSSDGSGAGLLSNNNSNNNLLAAMFAHIFGGGNQAPQMNSPGLPTGVSVAQPGSSYEAGLENMGPAGQWPTGSTVVPGQYVLGPSEGDQPGQILATGSDASATPGGGGMSAGQMGSSAIGAIGSGLSNIGKNIASTKATYTAPNLPLPQRAQFVPPTLAPNRNVSF